MRILSAVIFVHVFTSVVAGGGEIKDSQKEKVIHPLTVIIRPLPSGTTVAYHPYELKLNGNEKSYKSDNYDDKQISFCPAENQRDENLQKGLKPYYPAAEYCLFEKSTTPGEQIKCNKEPEPVIIVSREGYLSNCGLKEDKESDVVNTEEKSGNQKGKRTRRRPEDEKTHGTLHKFTYQLCWPPNGIQTFLETEKKERNEKGKIILPTMYDLYSYYICYDNTNQKTHYTEHTVWSAKFFNEPALQEEREYESRELSTEPYYFANPRFSELNEAYKKRNGSSYTMVPHLMVPKEHMAFGLWKKPTEHMANTAPLWGELVPLVNMIDNRIKNYAIETNRYVQVFTIAAFSDKVENSTPTYLDPDNIFLIPNLWIKVIYYMGDIKEHISIVIHNTPNNPPNVKICGDTIPKHCDFKKWLTPADQVSEELMKYAYCCETNTTIVQLYSYNFPVAINTRNVLNIDPVDKGGETSVKMDEGL